MQVHPPPKAGATWHFACAIPGIFFIDSDVYYNVAASVQCTPKVRAHAPGYVLPA